MYNIKFKKRTRRKEKKRKKKEISDRSKCAINKGISDMIL